MENRKVIFRLGDVDDFNPDTFPEEQDEQEKKGNFHCWAPCLEHNPQIDQMVPSVCAIIEDEEGRVHEVPVRWIVKFCDPLLK